MKLYSSVCFGLLVLFWCPGDDTPVAVSDFCEITRPQLSDFRLSKAEANALSDDKIRKLSALRTKYRRLCTEKQPKGR